MCSSLKMLHFFSLLFILSLKSAIQWVLGVLLWGLKWLGHEDEHSHPYSASVKNECSCTAAPCVPSWCVQEQLCLDLLPKCSLLLSLHHNHFIPMFHAEQLYFLAVAPTMKLHTTRSGPTLLTDSF
jgi:hypothetical protein